MGKASFYVDVGSQSRLSFSTDTRVVVAPEKSGWLFNRPQGFLGVFWASDGFRSLCEVYEQITIF